jgi:hypothetical protein
MLKRISQNEVTMVFQVYFSAGWCDMRNLSASFGILKGIAIRNLPKILGTCLGKTLRRIDLHTIDEFQHRVIGHRALRRRT